MDENESRIFRSLATEWPHDTVDQIRVELTRGPEVASEEVEAALEGLQAAGLVEEFKPGHWRLTPNGHGKKPSLLGARS